MLHKNKWQQHESTQWFGGTPNRYPLATSSSDDCFSKQDFVVVFSALNIKVQKYLCTVCDWSRIDGSGVCSRSITIDMV